MHYGIYLSSVDQFADPNLLAELAQEAEEAGWDGVFIWDHIGRPNQAADPWVALAAMAMKTKRVKIGPIVTPVARRRPWKLARETVTLDHLSNGRLILGTGLGYSSQEFEAFGEFDIVVILWSEGGRIGTEQLEAAKYKEAGVTWWLEDLSTERFSSLADIRQRLHKGAPGV